MDANQKQDALLGETTITFETIKQDIDVVSESIETQADYMSKISTSNGEINESVEGLSAFSEELLANTENKQGLTEKTMHGTEKINQLLEHVMNDVESLQGML